MVDKKTTKFLFDLNYFVMEKRHFYLLWLMLCCNFMYIQAQWDNLPGQYWTVRSYLNPSFTGETEAIRTTALYRFTWIGIKNAPQQIYLSADMPIDFPGNHHGVGLTMYSESTGNLRNSLLTAQYSFKKKIGNGFLNLGLQGGIYDLQFDAGDKQILEDSLQFSRGVLKVNPTDKQLINLNAGISWSGKFFFAGFSIMHINQPRFYTYSEPITAELQNDSTRSHIPRSLNLIMGYNISPFYSLEIQPMIFLQSVRSKSQMQATLRLDYDNKISGGLSWISNDGYLFFAGANIHDIQLGYAYGMHTKGVGKNSKGSHELYLQYNFPLDYFKPKRYPHKSIRLL